MNLQPTNALSGPSKLNLSCIEEMYMDKGRHLSYHITAMRAMKEISYKAKPAIIDELTNLTKKGVLTDRHWGDLTPTQRLRVLRSHTNVTHKVTQASDRAGWTEDRVKARHVGNGDGQNREK